ncbi:MAG: hypothetical protein KBT48_03375 [Firmicutes bacterium]|nr:hypothetical protein [Bacillota bacterium]
MKEFILDCEHDYIAFAIALLGVLFIIFPNQVSNIAHILLGLALLFFVGFSVIGYFKYKDKQVNIGKLIVYTILAIVILMEKGDDLHSLGIMWSVVSLQNVSEEINEFFAHHKFSFVRLIMIIISLGLALLLLLDPAHHFSSHVQILGIEVISTVFIREHHLKHKKK